MSHSCWLVGLGRMGSIFSLHLTLVVVQHDCAMLWLKPIIQPTFNQVQKMNKPVGLLLSGNASIRDYFRQTSTPRCASHHSHQLSVLPQMATDANSEPQELPPALGPLMLLDFYSPYNYQESIHSRRKIKPSVSDGGTLSAYLIEIQDLK